MTKKMHHPAASIALRLLASIAIGAALAACDEIPQDAPKPFVQDGEATAASASLADRARVQDEYDRLQVKP